MAEEQKNNSYCIVYNDKDEDYYLLLSVYNIKEPSVTLTVQDVIAKQKSGIRELNIDTMIIIINDNLIKLKELSTVVDVVKSLSFCKRNWLARNLASAENFRKAMHGWSFFGGKTLITPSCPPLLETARYLVHIETSLLKQDHLFMAIGGEKCVMIPACNNKTFLVTAQDVKTLTAITLLNIPEKNFTYRVHIKYKQYDTQMFSGTSGDIQSNHLSKNNNFEFTLPYEEQPIIIYCDSARAKSFMKNLFLSKESSKQIKELQEEGEQKFLQQQEQFQQQLKEKDQQIENHHYIIQNAHLVVDETKVLGEGSFGKVYSGNYYKSPVAIKFFEVKSTVKELEQEAKILISLRHPNIVSCLAYDTVKPRIITERMNYSLFNWIERHKHEKIPNSRIRSICQQICLGMHYLHSRDPMVMHRDLKSSNILMNDDFTIKIADFGLSKTRDLSNPKRTQTKAIVGSVPWAAPEYVDWHQMDKRSEKGDVFSFGVILWELVTREIPWNNTPIDRVCYDVYNGKRLEIPPNCNETFKDICIKCWNEDPTLRPSFKELLDIFEQTKIERDPILFLTAMNAGNKKMTNLFWNNTADAKQVFSVELVCPSKEKPFKNSYKYVCAVVTKGCFQDADYLAAIENAYKYQNCRIFLLHDIEDCPFPGEKEQPQSLKEKHLFDYIALPLINGYESTTWNNIITFLQTDLNVKEDISTSVFLSHKQATAQGIATTLYSQLENYFPGKVFLDVQAKFMLHKLEEIVKATKLFVFIVSDKIFDSYWCRKEFEAAVAHTRPIMIIRDIDYTMPEKASLPVEWHPYYDKFESMETYSAYMLHQCIKKIRDRIDNC